MGREETMSMCSDPAFSIGDGEERISVSVRLRPLSQRELTSNDVSDWECIDNTTVVFKSSFPDRSLFPTAYTFDRVFGSDCTTEQVYEEAAKEIALSVLSGINSSIFAYGQTSSGKTYTMSGVTECAIADIFEYIDKHQEREFVLKFSAMEIYNEHVRDLFSSESTPLRLLDDPEKGTVVERLIEETLEDWDHLQELLSICQAQRQIGETSLNETSSRSHQILRLTVESSTQNYSASGNSSTLVATVNFVDLAGSERASQTMAAGVRLKEGSHINRSLLTLGTVIRKLSKGRNGHVPYRDSKLTRILQNSLGGNARTAIICTISPARSHIEQSRNTLLFASCAKEVTTNAQVNLVMSDKALVKQLQRELARLESQLSSIGSMSTDEDSIAALREKDLQIEEMRKEIKELTEQRDYAQSCVANLLKSVGDDQHLSVEKYSAQAATTRSSKRKTSDDFGEQNGDSPGRQIMEILETLEDDFLLDDSTPKFTGLDLCEGWEDIAQGNGIASEVACKELQCIETPASTLTSIHGSEKEDHLTETMPMDETAVTSIQKEDTELTRVSSVNSCKVLKQKIQELHEAINSLQQCPLSEGNGCGSEGFMWARSKSRRSILVTIPSTLWSDKEDATEIFKLEEEFPEKAGAFEQKIGKPDGRSSMGNISRIGSQESLHSDYAEESITTNVIDVHVDDTTTSALDSASKFNELQSVKDNGVALVPEAISKNDEKESTRDIDTEKDDMNWSLQFERNQRKIMELWVKCYVPLVHRSFFFLLVKGDPSDNVYMEVELRRLHFLYDTLLRGAYASKGIDGRIITSSSSLKALNREREMLAKQLQKKFAGKDREDLYRSWGINLQSKRRSLQLAYRLWTDTSNSKHIKESATLVAKLVGLLEPQHVPKEIFGLSLSTLSISRSSRW